MVIKDECRDARRRLLHPNSSVYIFLLANKASSFATHDNYKLTFKHSVARFIFNNVNRVTIAICVQRCYK